MPIYLRTFFRVLSSWVHRGVIGEGLRAPRFLLLPFTPAWTTFAFQPVMQEHGKALDRKLALRGGHVQQLRRQQPDRARSGTPGTAGGSFGPCHGFDT